MFCTMVILNYAMSLVAPGVNNEQSYSEIVNPFVIYQFSEVGEYA